VIAKTSAAAAIFVFFIGFSDARPEADRPARQPGVKPGRRWTVQPLLFCLGAGETGFQKISFRRD
jgi:hypothetical protein